MHNLYLQCGDEPSDADPCIGFIILDDVAGLIADQVSVNPWTVNEIKLSTDDQAV